MAVTIGEVQVEVKDTPAPQSDPQGRSGPPRPRIDLADAIARLRDRHERLKAD
jgi:hypothetical protein